MGKIDIHRINEASERWGDAVVSKVFKELMTQGRKRSFQYFENVERYDYLACLVFLTQGESEFPS
jgi:hypothetical protein